MSKKKKNNSARPAVNIPAPPAGDLDPEAVRMIAALEAMPEPIVTTDDDGVVILPGSMRDRKEGQFRFRVDGHDNVQVLPKMQYIDFDLAQRLPTMKPEAVMDALFERYAPHLLGSMDIFQIKALLTAWKNDSMKGASTAVGLGESKP